MMRHLLPVCRLSLLKQKKRRVNSTMEKCLNRTALRTSLLPAGCEAMTAVLNLTEPEMTTSLTEMPFTEV